MAKTPTSAAAPGLTAAQYSLVLSTIATQAGELRDLLMRARNSTDNEGNTVQAAHSFFVAERLAAFIGAIADDASGSSYLGGPASWATGDDISPDNGRGEVTHD